MSSARRRARRQRERRQRGEIRNEPNIDGRARWVGRTNPLIAEVAEAVGINTDDVMAAMPTDAGRVVVALFTAGAEETRHIPPREIPVSRIELVRDDAGVLRSPEPAVSAGVFGDYLPTLDGQE